MKAFFCVAVSYNGAEQTLDASCHRWLRLGAAASDGIKSFSPSSDWTELLSLILTEMRGSASDPEPPNNTEEVEEIQHSKRLFIADIKEQSEELMPCSRTV